jgi:peptidoglycan/LPS O-acetylase OafA/YrhL
MSHPSRFAFLDLLRVLAAQLIVLHHLAFYGPLSEHAHAVAAGPIDWLFEYGRLAVQVFFVAGGYCLAGGLARRPIASWGGFGRMAVDRYLRLGLPYLAALAVAIAANEVARLCMVHPSISASPTLGQLLAHVLLLHNVLGYEALTAGIWYVAIDLQLGVLVALVYVVAARLSVTRGQVIARWALLALGVLSAFFWNRVPGLDRFAIYFLASYVLGMAGVWSRDGSMPKGCFWAYLGVIGLALYVDFRVRLAVAAATAVILVLTHGWTWLDRISSIRPLRQLALISYSLFLIHFPICLVVNAWWSSRFPPDPRLSLLGMAVAWCLSMAGGFLFYHLVESRLARLRLRGAAGESSPARATA